MPDKLAEYKCAGCTLPEDNSLWPLYGAGFDNLGDGGGPIRAPMPDHGPDELLVRHDACGLCFSDIKVIKLGQEHPRIYRDMRTRPVVLGHEVSMTVVGVGAELRGRYRIGDRFIIQAEIRANGVGCAYGYEIDGGLSRYGRIDQRVLNGDAGNYLIPVRPGTGYAEAALIEPWACVIAAYQLQYRTSLKAGGTAWIIGAGREREEAQRYTISAGFDEGSHPDRLFLTAVPPEFAAWLGERAAGLGVEVTVIDDLRKPPAAPVDDLVLLGADADLIEAVSPCLAEFGVAAIIAESPLPRKVAVDVGRVHYHRWVYIGGRGPDIAEAYRGVPVRSALKAGGRSWFVGAGGPIGRMHVQRAIQLHDPEMGAGGPASIVCTDISASRLAELRAGFAAEAEARGIEFLCLNPQDRAIYEAGMASGKTAGFDDIVVLTPAPAVIADAATYLAPRGVMNIFAGVNRGIKADLDLSDAYLRDTRVIGHSASTIDDLRFMLDQAEAGRLSPNRSVAAIGSLDAARDGLLATRDTVFPGKVVIFPQIKEMPLTALPDLKDKLPSVHARLREGREWTTEAEEEFLRLMLP